MMFYTSTHYFIESATGKICHMHYLIWSPPIRIRKEGRGLSTHFQEKQPQVLDFRYATLLQMVKDLQHLGKQIWHTRDQAGHN